jgi:hypothetical protein
MFSFTAYYTDPSYLLGKGGYLVSNTTSSSVFNPTHLNQRGVGGCLNQHSLLQHPGNSGLIALLRGRMTDFYLVSSGIRSSNLSIQPPATLSVPSSTAYSTDHSYLLHICLSVCPLLFDTHPQTHFQPRSMILQESQSVSPEPFSTCYMILYLAALTFYTCS